jgi:hypothetical protein
MGLFISFVSCTPFSPLFASGLLFLRREDSLGKAGLGRCTLDV